MPAADRASYIEQSIATLWRQITGRPFTGSIARVDADYWPLGRGGGRRSTSTAQTEEPLAVQAALTGTNKCSHSWIILNLRTQGCDSRATFVRDFGHDLRLPMSRSLST